jgi:hypothetical protein
MRQAMLIGLDLILVAILDGLLRKPLLSVTCRSVALAQGLFFADEFTLLRAAEVSLSMVVIDAGASVDPNNLIPFAGKLRWHCVRRSLCVGPRPAQDSEE